MSEDVIVCQAAPTLAGIKTGSLFPYRVTDMAALKADVRAMNRILVPRGICVLLLRVMKKSALLYLYRPRALAADLKNSLARKILLEAGYSCESCGACVRGLAERFRRIEGFPHEIGLFLGYPPEDVLGFMCGDRCKAVCLWKVYGDEDKARRTCDRYRKCTACYLELWKKGVSLEKLAVSF